MKMICERKKRERGEREREREEGREGGQVDMTETDDK